ncbi:DUF6285 domain-containing protein [Actinomarinicola tropica]|uniref:DUF6285 domain-containing protein n=1 Tax=Actinomarinicola tropica TaxID=2789776 RepID=A0A5Q2RGG6_9ACTN|nr:DUF6285 domain-containing protein [Actinomarinicola tropica]QGG93701.1 hypothetical protein GH723_00450 [Actinomarinicola tropica]
MTQPRPTAVELLDAVRSFLEEDVMASVEGRVQFHARVAVNVLSTVIRELEQGDIAEAAERAGLVDLLGHDGPLDELVEELAGAIRDGSIDVADPALLAHLRATARADVEIANPRHAAD